MVEGASLAQQKKSYGLCRSSMKLFVIRAIVFQSIFKFWNMDFISSIDIDWQHQKFIVCWVENSYFGIYARHLKPLRGAMAQLMRKPCHLSSNPCCLETTAASSCRFVLCNEINFKY